MEGDWWCEELMQGRPAGLGAVGTLRGCAAPDDAENMSGTFRVATSGPSFGDSPGRPFPFEICQALLALCGPLTEEPVGS